MKLPLGFRSLFDELREQGADVSNLHSNLNEIYVLLDKLRMYGEPEARHKRVGRGPTLDKQMLHDIWELYALSRVNDLLILRYQPGCDNTAGWKGPNVSMEEYYAFITSLGMRIIEQNAFHPVYHEIVEVEQSLEEDEPISVSEIFWPGFMLGNMIFSRCGIKARGGSNYIRKEVAENSTLYWAFRRGNRPVSDLSHGWGSNSQWRTEFRRDYVIENQVFYHADGTLDARFPNKNMNSANPAREELTLSERIELITNRCFILTQKPHDDLWPFNDFYIKTL